MKLLSLWFLTSKRGSGPISAHIFQLNQPLLNLPIDFALLQSLHLHPRSHINNTNNKSFPNNILHNNFFIGSYIFPKKMNKHSTDKVHQNP